MTKKKETENEPNPMENRIVPNAPVGLSPTGLMPASETSLPQDNVIVTVTKDGGEPQVATIPRHGATVGKALEHLNLSADEYKFSSPDASGKLGVDSAITNNMTVALESKNKK